MAENPVKHSVTSTTQGAHREVSRLSTAWSCRAVNLREKKTKKTTEALGFWQQQVYIHAGEIDLTKTQLHLFIHISQDVFTS